MITLNTFEHAGKTVKIVHDEDAESPRTAFDNLTTMVTNHRWLRIGDIQLTQMPETEEDLREMLLEEPLAVLPLYLYGAGAGCWVLNAGDLVLTTEPRREPLGYGFVGWAYVERSSAEKMGVLDLPDFDYEAAIRAEVETLAAYLRGDCFGYKVEGRDGDVLDSCWGFYSEEECVESAKEAAEHCGEDPAIEREVSELENRATYAVNTVDYRRQIG